MTSRLSSLTRLAGTAGLALALSLGAGSALADSNEPHAFLYQGTCDDITPEVMAIEIDDLDNDDATEHWAQLGNGQDKPDGLLASSDDISEFTSVQQVVDGDYVVAVHESQARDSAVLVCGEVEGTVDSDSLLIELDEVDGSTFEGRSFIHLDHDDDDDDDEIEFVVGIYPTGSVEPLESATPAA